MNKYKNAGMVLGFTLMILGFTSLILTMVGIHWYFLGWIESFGRLLSFIFKMVMVLAGVVMFIVARTDWDKEKEESR